MQLMSKKKQPTPQEIYRARKQKAEDEKDAFLPPGLVNHGNTCFMNSVLQGLIATPILYDIVRFTLPQSYAPIASRRSPQLTNGHGRGAEAERPWEQGMPLGDIFVVTMEKAWRLQNERTRNNISPIDILRCLGSKYDQYLDFRQQDAHELLRHLLDAMRMEELDIIKKRQPPPAKPKRKRAAPHAVPERPNGSGTHDTANRSNASGSTGAPIAHDEIAEEDRLTSFVDMVFGGQLASILVCDACKKISFTYEDFNDISLSIKPEDYQKTRKRDRLKTFAKKLAKGQGLDFSRSNVRSSSVPASPTRKSFDTEQVFELPASEPRRRSLDTDDVYIDASGEPVQENSLDSSVSVIAPADENATVSAALASGSEAVLEEKELSATDGGDKSGKEDEGWVKLSRRISTRIGFSKKGQSGKVRTPKGSPQIEKSSSANSETPSLKEEDEVTITVQDSNDNQVDVPTTSTAVSSDEQPNPLSESTEIRPISLLAQVIAPVRTLSSQSLNSSRPPSSTRQSTRESVPRLGRHSRKEDLYLRTLLADVPSSSSNPFQLFKPQSSSNPSTDSGVAGLWAKVSHMQSIEDCFRMFTGVEVMDGENKVGCRRCWKMENNQYPPPRAAHNHSRDDKDDSDSTDEEKGSLHSEPEIISIPASPYISALKAPSTVQTAPPTPSSLELNAPDILGGPRAVDTSVVESQTGMRPIPQRSSSLPQTYGGRPVPSISMTAPEVVQENADVSLPLELGAREESAHDQDPDATVKASGNLQAAQRIQAQSVDSLRLPDPHSSHRHRLSRRQTDKSDVQSSEGEMSDLSSDDESADSDASAGTSALSDASSRGGSTLVNPSMKNGVEHPRKPPKVSRVKQVIFRRTYKRYLISKPPPVLVVHLKRFQQVGKTPVQFFGNFKKLDDFVSFPEYFDLTPYILPSKEEIVKKSRRHAGTSKDAERCVYRLYAVVVHIGNMLGGHYIAYTALPESPSQPPDDIESTTREAKEPPTSRTTSFNDSCDPKQKAPSTRKWCYISDTIVRLTTLEEVLKAKAYICMYERIYL